MNFTREPVIETVISPKEGSKLLLRNSKGNHQEDYCVDAVEVVSFGSALFFRSTERPKSFLVPVSDYEVVEVKETRMILKTSGTEKTIKIQNTQESALKKESSQEQQKEKNKTKKRTKRKKGSSNKQQNEERNQPKEEQAFEKNAEDEGTESIQKEENSPSFFRKLFPPPPTLIKENLDRYKDEPFRDENVFPLEDVEQEEFLIEEGKPSLSSPDFPEDFPKSVSDPEVLEDTTSYPPHDEGDQKVSSTKKSSEKDQE